MAGKRFLRYIPFGRKLMISYLILITIPVLIVGYAANSIFVASIQETSRSNIQGTLRQMKDNIHYKVEDLIRISNMLYFDRTLAAHLKHYERGWASYQAATTYLLPKMHSVIDASNQNIWISLYLHNDTLPEVYDNYEQEDPLLAGSRLFDIYHIDRIQEKAWYREFPDEVYGQTMQWRQIEDDRAFGRMSFLRRIVEIRWPMETVELGFMRISASLSDLFESVDYRKIGEGTVVFIADQDGYIFASSATSDLPAEFGPWNGKEEPGVLVLKESLPEVGWEIIALIPADIAEQETVKVRNITFLICAANFVIFFWIGAMFSKYFAKRVTKIVSVLDSFQEGEFRKRIHFKSNDEFSRISAALNEMGQNIGELIHRVYITELEKKEAELESLQAQINPHFLYNTLSSIYRMAKFGNVENIQQMVLDLARFYRLSLSEGRSVIPIRDELEQVKAYLNIQKIKYGERMSVYFDVQPEVLEYDTLKLILQPFVENVLEHAWCGDHIGLKITGRIEGDAVVFRVIDDGIGMRQELVDRLNHPTLNHIGYGIRNVAQRIQLYYGPEYGVKLFSRLGIGTTVTIAIPKSKEKPPHA